MSTIHPDLADQLGQYRYILSRLGLSLWASKNDDQQLYHRLPIYRQDVLVGLPTLRVDMQNSHQDSQGLQAYHKPPLDFSDVSKSKATAQLGKTDNQPDPGQQEQNLSTSQPISYHLAAVAYGSWILLVEDRLPSVEQGVWLSLIKALENKARLDQTFYQFRQLDYPLLDDMPDADQSLIAQMSFRGFVFGLTNTDISAEFKLACLGDLPDGLKSDMLDGLVKVVQLPSLAQMSTNADLKKQFWQTIHTKD